MSSISRYLMRGNCSKNAPGKICIIVTANIEGHLKTKKQIRSSAFLLQDIEKAQKM